MPFELQKASKERLQNWGPLSVTIRRGRPSIAKILEMAWMVVSVVMREQREM